MPPRCPLSSQWILLGCMLVASAKAQATAHSPSKNQIIELSPEKLLTATLKSSERVRAILELRALADLEALAARAPLDTTLKARSVWIDDRHEGSSPYSVSNSKTFENQIEASKYLKSGTLLQATLSHTKFQGSLPAFEIRSHEPFAELSLAQNLLRDAFGSDRRKLVRAGEILSDAKKIESEILLEDWALGIISAYYSARALQQQLVIFDETVLLRQKLSRVASIRAKRGTLEEKDLKKIRASLSDSELQLRAVEDDLKSALSLLVTLADLPRDYLRENVRNFPLLPGQLQKISCQSSSSLFPKTSKEEHLAELESQAYELRAEAARGSLLPELRAFASVGANAVDESATDSWNKISRNPKTVWKLGLEVKWTLDDGGAKSHAAQARLAWRDREAKAREERDLYEVKRDEICRQLDQFQKEESKRIENSNDLKRALSLQERDFGVGRSTVFEIVQANEEWLNAKRALTLAERNLWQTKWKLLKLEGGLIQHLESLAGAKL